MQTLLPCPQQGGVGEHSVRTSASNLLSIQCLSINQQEHTQCLLISDVLHIHHSYLTFTTPHATTTAIWAHFAAAALAAVVVAACSVQCLAVCRTMLSGMCPANNRMLPLAA